jgi:hypothetical protein
MMRSIGGLLSALTHLQVLMACSAVAFVDAAALMVSGRHAGTAWLLASGLGTLGLYLLDGVRSADHEDAISQPLRAGCSRRHRGWITLFGLAVIMSAVVSTLFARPSITALAILCLMGFLGLAHVLPLVPWRGGWRTTKESRGVKPLSISAGWLIGALVIAAESCTADQATPWRSMIGFAMITGPLLLLDSIWLDRRDMRADLAFSRSSLSALMGSETFLVLRCILFLLALAGAPLLANGLPFLAWSWLGAACLLFVSPDRIRSEAARVWMAALWRFTGFVGVLVVFS